MATIVSSSEFRTRMGAMLALADKGEQVVIKRNRKPSYVLSSVEAENAEETEDNFFTPEMLAEYDQMVDDYYAGKLEIAAVLETDDDIKQFMASL